MSRRQISPHQLKQYILTALQRGAVQSSTLPMAITSATSVLRGQGIRVKPEEIEAVLNLTVRDALFPPCECIAPGAAALFEELSPDSADVPGPHHAVSCPMWRAVRA